MPVEGVSRRQFMGGGVSLLIGAVFAPFTQAFAAAASRSAAESRGAGGAGGVVRIELEPGDPPALAPLLAALPGFVCVRTPEWALLTDAQEAVARGAIELLEATTRQVDRAAHAIGVPPIEPLHRHLALLFRHLEGYRGFAAAHDGLHLSAIAGHYAPQARRSAFAAPTPSRALREAIALLRADEGSRAARSGMGAATRAAVDEAIDEIRQTMSRLTSHEAAHQVLFERGIHPEPARCPAWLAEGLACCFETERSIGDFGPDFDVPARRERFARVLARGGHLPLGALVALPHRPSHEGVHAPDWYAQSWALVSWLFRERPQALGEYLRELTRSHAWRSADRLASFERFFGEVTELERLWTSYWRARVA